MLLKQISITNFKNIASASLHFSPNINCIVGNNGEGKTNLLDAVYYLSMTKSYFGGSDLFNIRHGEQYFILQGLFAHEDEEQQVNCGVTRDEGKIFKRNSKIYNRLSDHVGLFPLVMISPTDNALINESGEERRKYMNSVLAQSEKAYLNILLRYNHILLQRNKLLKTPYGSNTADLLATIDEQLVDAGKQIYNFRKQLIIELQPYFSQAYNTLSEHKEEVSLAYRSELDKEDYAVLLEQCRDRDRAMQHTTTGIHRDELAMQIDGYPLRRTGSQGQQKTFLLALKLAQFELLRKQKGFCPLLLLDDIFDKLDAGRVHQLLSMVAQADFGQIFITDSNKVRVDSIVQQLTRDYTIYTAERGQFN